MINGSRVRQARELHRWTQGRLLDEVPDLTQSRLSRIESGAAVLQADGLVAASIAASTGVTTEWLRRPATPSLGEVSPHFRARSRTPQGTKAAGLAWAELVNEAHAVLGAYSRPLPVSLEKLYGIEPRQAARKLRRDLGFTPMEPLPYLILAVERLGVRVLGLPLPADTVDAFSAWSGDEPMIALLTGAPGDRRRWTTAHELAHLVLHGPREQGRVVEAEADIFASELLTPLDGLRQQMPANPTLNTLVMLKTQWGVSVKSLVRRARELGVVDEDRATSLYRQISARGWNKAEPGYVPLEKPRALRLMAEIARNGDPVVTVSDMLGWSSSLADEVLKQYARADELPTAVAPVRTGTSNVVPLAPRLRRS
jgi:Zn-dependent peptidase ImmA (M78 family)/transcriptional regulator with XRE-family HTH domain